MTQDAFASLGRIRDQIDAPDPTPKSGDGLPWFSGASLAGLDVPERFWLVKDLIPACDITLLGGDGGTGKSLLALHLACAVALRRPWLGRDVSGGVAMYLSAEDDVSELHRRLDAITRSERESLAALSDLSVVSLAGSGAVLAVPQPRGNLLSPTSRFADLEARVAQDEPALVVLDTLSDLWSGDENNRAQARQFVSMLRSIAIRYRCAVVLLAHPSLTGMANGSGLSGSTAWSNSVRSRLTLERIAQDGYEADPDRRKLVVRKANYASRGAEITMRWQDGVFAVEGGEDALDHRAAGSRAQRVFLDLLRLHSEQGRKVSAVRGPSFAPKVFEAHPNAEGVTSRAFSVAMENLLRLGKVEVAEYGPPSKRRSCLSEVV
ncbi:RecA-family ATPase [Roseovarius sp. MBR-51]